MVPFVLINYSEVEIEINVALNELYDYVYDVFEKVDYCG